MDLQRPLRTNDNDRPQPRAGLFRRQARWPVYAAGVVCCALAWLGLSTPAAAQTAALSALESSFRVVPNSARPIVWWFWGETVTTDEGITHDLEAMKRVGIGGVVVYEQVFTDRPDALKSLSPEWLARFRFAAAECARLGMTLEVNVSPGFVAGGPWITPELAMQRLVASEMVVTGGRRVAVTLPQPSTKLGYYRDVAVLAFPTPSGGAPDALPRPQVATQPEGVRLDGFFGSATRTMPRFSPPEGGGPVLIRLDYGQTVMARSLTYSVRTNSKALVIATQVATPWRDDLYGQNMRLNPPIGHLEASSDGVSWHRVCELPATGYQHDSWIQQTVAFAPTSARYFRLNFHDWGRNTRTNDNDLVIGGVELRGGARVDHWEAKSGNVVDFSYPDRTPEYAPGEAVDPDRIVDITSHLKSDGTLEWDAPAGSWTILRFGHTPTGAKTKHGRPESMGLECDKLSAAAVRVQFDHYVRVLLGEVRKVPGAKLAGVNIDSNEHGSQNWTADFPAQFERRRGYPILRYLPAMAGYVVGDRARSDRFLFDVRRTIADLMSDEYFGEFQRLCHAEGMTSMAQAPGIATCLPSDNIQAKGRTDIPMGEFWMTQPEGTIDCKEAASAAHVYGLPIAAAESFTGSRAEAHPGMMKPFADAALSLGINRFVVLAYVHQPWDDRKPGVTEERFYLPYQRHNTWWEEGKGFWETLGRSSEMMRQGLPVIDVLYHLGNDTPLKIATWRMRPIPPAGYDYDVCGDEVLVTRTRAADGRVVLPDGMSYRLLVLAGGDRMTLAAARQLRALVNAGACVLGPVKPTGTPMLTDGPEGDAEVRRIADELWGSADTAATGERRTGAGRLFWGMSPEQVLARLDTPRDFRVIGAGEETNIRFAHRRTEDADIYFVANARAVGEKITAAFRTQRAVAERWDPETGTVTTLQAKSSGGAEQVVPLVLEPYASAFVVFRNGSAAERPAAMQTLVSEIPGVLDLSDGWSTRFDPKWGAPEHVAFARLSSWTEHADPGVKYYSGTAVYEKSFDMPAYPGNTPVLLDLGDVGVIATVRLNGRDLGTVWKAPFAVDVTPGLRVGRNDLEVRVVNLWNNRLIADSSLPPERRLTWTTDNPYRSTDTLQKSGLLGPVKLRMGGSPTDAK